MGIRAALTVVTSLTVVAHVRSFRIEGFLLLGIQARVEGLRCFRPLREHGGALALTGLHALETLRRCQLGKLSAVGPLRWWACRGLRRCGEVGPGSFLRRAELELFFQCRHAFGPVLLHAGKSLGRISVVHAAMLGRWVGFADGSLSSGRSGRSRRRRWRRLREGSCSDERSGGQHAGPENTLAEFDHDVASF